MPWLSVPLYERRLTGGFISAATLPSTYTRTIKKDLQGTEVARSWKHYTLERKADRDDNLQETKDVT